MSVSTAQSASRTWLYLKLYPGRLDLLDAVATDVVGPFVTQHRVEWSRWFFLRYHDASGPHVRLRMSLEPDAADAIALEASDLAARFCDLRALRARICAIGPATRAAVESLHLKVDLMGKEYVAEGLLEAFGPYDLAGQRVLLPRAAVARDLVPVELARRHLPSLDGPNSVRDRRDRATASAN